VAAAVGLHNNPEKLIRFKKNKEFAAAGTGISGDCETTGPQTFTAELGIPLEKNDKFWVAAGGRLCSGLPSTCVESEPIFERFKVG
jgi:hypothetical protein